MATTTAVQPRPDGLPQKREYTNLEKALSTGFARDLTRFLGSEEAAAAFIAEIYNQARRVPELHVCTVESIRLNVARIAALRLNLALPNMVHLIPRNMKQPKANDRAPDVWAKELTIQYGYAALRELATRAPGVKDCFTREVCVNDFYEPPVSLTAPPTHRLPARFTPRGRVEGYYAVIELYNGNWRHLQMSVAQVEAHVKRYVREIGPAWEKGKRPDLEDGLTAFDKQALKTCLRMLCNGRDIPMSSDVRTALDAEEAMERRQTAAELQGYGPQGQRAALTAATGLPLDDLLQDVAGVRDKESVAVHIERETRVTAVGTPAGEAGLPYIARIEAAILRQPGGNVANWDRWAENRFRKSRDAFTQADWQAYLDHLERLEREQTATLPPAQDVVPDPAQGPAWGPESPDLFTEEEREATEYGE